MTSITHLSMTTENAKNKTLLLEVATKNDKWHQLTMLGSNYNAT